MPANMWSTLLWLRTTPRGQDEGLSTLRHIALEGPIGVGKTTLARRLSVALSASLLLEAPGDNPFLARFYNDPEAWALPTQLTFLLQRMRQARELGQRDLFSPRLISDFLVDKDCLFAQLTLASDQLALYQQLYDELLEGVPAPDLVIYLHAPIPVLLERINRRAIDYEQTIEANYLERLCILYAEFFAVYEAAPVIVVDTVNLNFSTSDRALNELLALFDEPFQKRRHLAAGADSDWWS